MTVPRRPVAVAAVTMLVVAVVVVLVRNAAAGAAPVAAGLADGQLAACASPGNCVTSTGTGDALVEPLRCTSDDVLRDLRDELDARGWEVVTERADGDTTYVHAVAVTRVLRFRDDVEFLVTDGDDWVRVRSESRIGASDLGTNRARVEDLRTTLAARCAG